MLKVATLFAKAAVAVSIQGSLSAPTCDDMELSGPMTIKEDDALIENLVIYAEPTSADSTANDYALKIVAENVTIRNVLIYHAANGMGIYAYEANNLVLDNVQVVAYGNEWGAQPCPTRKPFMGYECANIKIVKSEGVQIDNV